MALVKCPECEHMVSDTAIQCPSCGFAVKKYFERQNIIKTFEEEAQKEAYLFVKNEERRQQNEILRQEELKKQKEYEKIKEEEYRIKQIQVKEKKRKINTICVCLLSLFILILFSIQCYKIITKPQSLYKQAIEHLNNKEYKQAIEKFDSLGEYKDSILKLKETYYQYGIALWENNNIEESRKILQNLSQEEIINLQLQEISNYTEWNDRIPDLIDLFKITAKTTNDRTTLNNYLKRILNNSISIAINNEDYVYAKELFLKPEDLGLFKFSELNELKIGYDIAVKLFELKDYKNAVDLFNSINRSKNNNFDNIDLYSQTCNVAIELDNNIISLDSLIKIQSLDLSFLSKEQKELINIANENYLSLEGAYQNDSLNHLYYYINNFIIYSIRYYNYDNSMFYIKENFAFNFKTKQWEEINIDGSYINKTNDDLQTSSGLFKKIDYSELPEKFKNDKFK